MKKYYYIPEENKTIGFTIQCRSKTSDGKSFYIAHSTITGEEVWLFDNAIEFCERKKYSRTIYAYEVQTPPSGTLSINQYVWGGEVRDKRANSMCARPYYPR